MFFNTTALQREVQANTNIDIKEEDVDTIN